MSMELSHAPDCSNGLPTYEPVPILTVRQDRSRDRVTQTALYRPGRTPPATVSYSSLNQFSFCPAAWAFKRFDTGVTRTVDDATERARALGVATHGLLDSATRPSTDSATRPSTVMASAEKLIEWEKAHPGRSGLIATEVEFRAEINGFSVTSVADAYETDADGAAMITEYKTGRTPPAVGMDRLSGEPIYAARTTRQAVLYGVVANAAGVPVERVQMLYLASRTAIKIDLSSHRGGVLQREALRFLDYQGGRLYKSIASGYFNPRPGPGRCRTCDFVATCPFAEVDSTSPASVGAVEVAVRHGSRI